MNTMPEPEEVHRCDDAGPASLAVLNGRLAGTMMAMCESRRYTIGSDKQQALAFDDALVEPLHATLYCDGPHWRIKDNHSTNGTHLNSRRVTTEELRPGDLIQIGEQILVFTALERSTNRLPSFEGSPAGGVLCVFSEGRFSSTDSAPLSTHAGRVDLLLQLPESMRNSKNLEDMIACALSALRIRIGARKANLWLHDDRNGPRVFGGSSDNAWASDPTPQVLTSWVMRRNEALCVSVNDSVSLGQSNQESGCGTAIGAPVPGDGSPPAALECFQSGRDREFDPTDLDFVVCVARLLGLAWENFDHRHRSQTSKQPPTGDIAASKSRIMGNSKAINSLRQQIARVAPTDSTVLTLGESGTGKELVAIEIHEQSRRSSGPFVAVNCAAYNESLLESELFGHEKGAFTGANNRRLGQFERANHGTIFLDEVGELMASCQAKLLRLLEGQPFERLGGIDPVQVDVRIIAATNRNLMEMVRKGQFREDLWYRLRVIELRTPPLRERGNDVLELADHFLERHRTSVAGGPVAFSAEAKYALRNHNWPGNVRELRNALERAVVLESGIEISAERLGLNCQPEDSSVEKETLAEIESRHIEGVLSMVGGNKTEACRILGISRATLYSKLKEK